MVERKAADVDLQGDLDANGDLVRVIGTFQQGTASYNRIGRKCVVDQIHCQGNFQVNGNAFAQPIRIALVCYRTGGTNDLPTVPDIWQGITATGAVISTPPAQCSRNLNQTDKYKILAVKDFQIGDVTAGLDTSNLNRQFNWHLKNLNIKQKYSGTQAADLVTGGLWFVATGPDAVVVPVSIYGSCRVKIIDM